VSLDRAMAPSFRRRSKKMARPALVDLCSGGIGPAAAAREGSAPSGVPIHATLTDLFPNSPAFEAIAAPRAAGSTSSRAGRRARRAGIAAGMRTIFNGLSSPEAVRRAVVLQPPRRRRSRSRIFEVSRSPPRHLSAC
jgi:hypothetical protein